MFKNNITWIFFDIGATLIDETEAYNHRVRDAITGTSVTEEQFHKKRAEFASQNLRGDAEAIAFFGLIKTPWHTEDEYPYADAEDVLKDLTAKGFRIGVIANQPLGTADRLKKWGLLPYIDVVAASAELNLAKPNTAIFECALRMANCTAAESVMIGDRLDNDIVPAKSIGMHTIWIKQGPAIYHAPTCEAETPDFTVNTLSELKNLF